MTNNNNLKKAAMGASIGSIVAFLFGAMNIKIFGPVLGTIINILVVVLGFWYIHTLITS